jgi:hypothetical protein
MRGDMINRHIDTDAAADLLQRRWFAAFKAASGVRTECEALLEVIALTETAWRRARVRLVELEALRDALGQELELLEERDGVGPVRDIKSVMSAA